MAVDLRVDSPLFRLRVGLFSTHFLWGETVVLLRVLRDTLLFGVRLLLVFSLYEKTQANSQHTPLLSRSAVGTL